MKLGNKDKLQLNNQPSTNVAYDVWNVLTALWKSTQLLCKFSQCNKPNIKSKCPLREESVKYVQRCLLTFELSMYLCIVSIIYTTKTNNHVIDWNTYWHEERSYKIKDEAFKTCQTKNTSTYACHRCQWCPATERNFQAIMFKWVVNEWK